MITTNYIRLGYIVGSYGFKGYVKLKSVTDNINLFFTLNTMLLGRDNLVEYTLDIEEIKSHKDNFIVKFSGINNEIEAKALKFLSVLLPIDQLPAEEDNDVYWYKIEGADVIDESGELIGKLVDYLEVSENDIFRIQLLDGEFALISNNPDHVTKIDSVNRFITIDSIGLISEKKI